jgi:hypothetical protein
MKNKAEQQATKFRATKKSEVSRLPSLERQSDRNAGSAGQKHENEGPDRNRVSSITIQEMRARLLMISGDQRQIGCSKRQSAGRLLLKQARVERSHKISTTASEVFGLYF